MTNRRPLVSVVAVCYNQSRFVIECLDSIRNQTYPNLELIIMDDCSQDDSATVIQKWLHENQVAATFIAHQKNEGICKTFNEGVIRARGEFIAIVAADDVYLPHKIELQVTLFEKLPPDVGVIYGDAWQIDSQGNLLSQKFIESHRPLQMMPEGFIFPTLLEGNFIPAMTTLLRRRCYETVGLYDETLDYEDFDMWLRLSRHYRFVFLPEISAKYRVLSTSITRAVLEKHDWVLLRSNFRIFEKCFWAKGISPEQHRYVELRLNQIAWDMYRRGCKGRNYYLLRILRCGPRKYAIAALVFSVAGLRFETFLRIASWWKSLQKRNQMAKQSSVS